MKGVAILVTLFLIAVVVIGFPVFLVYKVVSGVKNQGRSFRNLVRDGRSTTAEITEVLGGGALAGDTAAASTTRVVRYSFAVPGRGIYAGEFSSHQYDIGDKLDVEYVPSDPSQNSPSFLVEKGRESAPASLLSGAGNGRDESSG